MTDLTKTLTKGALGTLAAGAMAFASASPAMADDRDRGGVDAGDVIAGALVVGGIAALAGAFDGDKDRRYHRDYHNHRGDGYYKHVNYKRYPNRRQAVNRCIRAAERQARRFGGWRYANVTSIRDVDRTRSGFRVKGRLEVEGNRWIGRAYDRGRFTCRFDGRGRPFVDFRKIRGL